MASGFTGIASVGATVTANDTLAGNRVNVPADGTTSLYQAIGIPDTVGCNPLIPVRILVVEDTADHTKTTTAVSVTLKGGTLFTAVYKNK